MTTIHPWRSRSWSAPDFFEQLRSEGELATIDELIRSFTYFTAARLQLLSDPRALPDQETLLELRKLKDSCRQVGASRMAFLCGEIEKVGLNPQSDSFRHLMDTLRHEGRAVMHDMRIYAIRLKKQAEGGTGRSVSRRRLADSSFSGNAAYFAPLPEPPQEISCIVRTPNGMSTLINLQKM